MKVFQFVLCWLLAVVPLGWGITMSVIKSLPLFESSPPPPAAPARP